MTKESTELGMSAPVGWPKAGVSSSPVSVVASFLAFVVVVVVASRQIDSPSFPFSRSALIRLAIFVHGTAATLHVDL